MLKNIAWLSLFAIVGVSTYACNGSSGGAPAPASNTTTTPVTTPTALCGTTPWKGDTKYTKETDSSGVSWAVFRLCDVAATDHAHELGQDGDGYDASRFPLPYVGQISFKAKGIDRAYLLDDPPFHLLHFHFASIMGSMNSDDQISAMLWENSGSYGGALIHVVDSIPTRSSSICFPHPATGHFMCEHLYVYGPVNWTPSVTYSTTCDWDTNVALHCVIKDDTGAVVFDQTGELDGGTIADMILFSIGNQAKDASRGGRMPSVKVTELEFKLKM